MQSRNALRFKITYVLVLLMSALLIAQENQLSYLSQKLMLENTLRERITSALDKLLDDIRFVVDVKAEIEFAPIEQTRTIIEDKQASETAKTTVAKTPRTTTPVPETKKAPSTTTTEPKQTYSPMNLPLPGFETPMDYAPSTKQPETEAPAPEATPTEHQPEAPATATVESGKPAAVSTQIQKTTVPIPVIKRQEINIILEDGVEPEMIENVRQVVAVAAHYDRARGDVLSIMTASFKKKKEQDAAEAIILKNIAEKIDDLEKRQADAERTGRIEQQKRLERQAIVRDSLKVEELKRQIAELQTKLQTPQISEAQRQVTEQETSQREQELANLRDQLKESNRRLQELELGTLETTPPSIFGLRNVGLWIAVAAALVLFFILLIVLISNRRKQEKRQEIEWGYGTKIPLGPRPAKPAAPAPAPTVATPPVQPTPPPVIASTPTPVPEPVAPAPKPAPAPDVEAQREELKSMKQSVISMAVGQPDTASRIINNWLSEEIKPTETESET